MWSDKELDDAFRRLAPPEPKPEPFPLDAWLRLETKLDKAAMERQFRQRLWKFFAGEMAVVAIAALVWLAWPVPPAATPATPGNPRAAGPATTATPSPARPPETAATRRRETPAAIVEITTKSAANNSPTLQPNATEPISKPSVTAAKATGVAAAIPATNSSKSTNYSSKITPNGLVAGARPSTPSHLAHGPAAATDSVVAFTSGRSSHAAIILAASSKRHSLAASAAREKSARPSTATRKSAAINQPAHTPALAPIASQNATKRHQEVVTATVSRKAATAQVRRHSAHNDVVALAHATSRSHAATTKARLENQPAGGAATANITSSSATANGSVTGNGMELPAATAEIQPLTIALIALNHSLPTPLATLPVAPLAPLPEPLRQPRLYFGLVGAPDVSSVKMADFQPPTPNLGITLEYCLTDRLRVSTGLLRGTKNYRARRQDYDWSYYPIAANGNFEWVDGSCTILDMPLNLRYDIRKRPRYQLFGSAGLSSLFMQHETYAYDVEYGGYQHHWQRSFTNENQHWLSVLNLSAGYEHNLSRHWRLQAEPYVKLPLGGVGAGKVRLASGGVFFGVKYGF